MTRPNGFTTADIAVNLLNDPKFSRLARRQNDCHATDHAFAIYLSTVLAGWGTGDRARATDNLPWWHDLPDDGNGQVLADMVTVGLLDADFRIPEAAWANWFGPAAARRERWKEGGRKGGLATQSERSQASATLEPGLSHPKPLQDGRDRTGRSVPDEVLSRPGFSQAEATLKPGLAPATKLPPPKPMSDVDRAEAIRLNQAIIADPKANPAAQRAAESALARLKAPLAPQPEPDTSPSLDVL
jgi:hypothetical protein